MNKMIHTSHKRDDKMPFYKKTDVTDVRIPPLDESANKENNMAVFKIINEKYSMDDRIIKQKGFPPHKHGIYNAEDNRRLRTNMQFRKEHFSCYNYFFVSLCISFIFGLAIGVVLMGSTHTNVQVKLVPRQLKVNDNLREGITRTLNSIKDTEFQRNDNRIDVNTKHMKMNSRYSSVSFVSEKEKDDHKYNKEVYPKGMTEDMKDILKDNKMGHHKHKISAVVGKNDTNIFLPSDRTVIFEDIYWGPEVENSLPEGYGKKATDIWESYMEQAEVVKMELGCGRMQNRLVTFSDGLQACVRYRQNTDQIQGEIFSFYVAKLLNLTNLAPSVVKVVDVKDQLWKNVANDIATAQWSSNRAVVLTQYIPSLESANIPEIFKPSSRHLNKFDVLKMSLKENDTVSKSQVLLEKLKLKHVKKSENKNEKADFDHLDLNLSKKSIDSFVELAQWSDLIIFDYLTANLDRIVNNLFNYQWNINIMDGPAHNLARKIDSGLLLFLDNESGLLHGYRLLKKYNVYHSLMLDNLCVFRKSTIDQLKEIFATKSVGKKLSEEFHKKNNAVIRDILPPLPEKNAKILHERIGKVLGQVEKCEQNFSNR
ncbi:extracellular serine/threonine protein kinase four-jointed [Plutella xylostella]|uniref:extracellular serine/threonine protein kinase four-jointed n=1 Tax=Plutella xylostella TaxID=51655 RepID=UPI00203301B9|nr:extracellular serine/threonine protein kinase four-jointed [Plutella xylostella]